MSDATGDWQAPDDQLITNVLARIGEQQHRRIFFERLENPLWVAALSARGVFASPPGIRTDEEGREYWQPWPDGHYLVRMAELVPGPVADALLSAAHSTNRIVQATILSAAVALPASEARRLLDPITTYIKSGSLDYAPEIADLIEKLAQGGMAEDAITIANAAFLPRPREEERPGLGRRRQVWAGLERHSYKELLPRVGDILNTCVGSRALDVLTRWLEAYLIGSDQWVEEDRQDVSHIWRPSISPHEQNHGYEDYGDALVGAIRDLGVTQARGGRPVAEIVATLEQSQQPLLIRLSVHVLARRVAEDPTSRDLAVTRLMDTDLLDLWCRNEYVDLATQALPHIGTEAAEAWQELVLGPPSALEERFERLAEYHRDEDEAFETVVARERDRWILRLLSGIDRESLPALCLVRRAELEAEYGVPEHPNFASWSSSWSGPTSPLTEDQLREMVPDELIDFLESWQPEASERWGPSVEGLSRAFQVIVKESPDSFAARIDRFFGMEPTYVGALLAGLREAVLAGNAFDWGEVLRLCQVVATKEDDGHEADTEEEWAKVWRYAQRGVASLIESATGVELESALGAEHFATAVKALEPLVGHADPTPTHEERFGGSNMDALTLSLNTTRPAVLRALIRVGSKARDELGERGDGSPLDQVVDSVLVLVGSRLAPVRDASLAEAAAFGEGFGRLLWMDRAWVEEREPALLSPDPFGDVVLTVALATYRPGKVLLEALTPAARRLLERVSVEEEITLGWKNDRSPVELLGDHLVMLLLWGSITRDHELVGEYFRMAGPSSTSRVLGHLGWMLGRSDDPIPNQTLERARELWDWRADLVRTGEADVVELSEFFWWARCEQFDPDWWLPRLAQAVESPEFDARGLIGERLEEVASLAPRQVAEILERLLEGREEPFGRYDLVRHAPGILVAALDSEDPEAMAVAERVMDFLGRGGQFQIKEIVEERRAAR